MAHFGIGFGRRRSALDVLLDGLLGRNLAGLVLRLSARPRTLFGPGHGINLYQGRGERDQEETLSVVVGRAKRKWSRHFVVLGSKARSRPARARRARTREPRREPLYQALTFSPPSHDAPLPYVGRRCAGHALGQPARVGAGFPRGARPEEGRGTGAGCRQVSAGAGAAGR